MSNATKLTMIEAINKALHDAMEADPRVLALGEEVGDTEEGGVFGATRGLSTKFGEHRVKSTPISEQAIIGAAIGASIAGYRPVAEIMLMNFTTVAMDMIVNQMAKIHYMFGGRGKVPMVLRTNIGAGRGAAAQHSQSFHSFFMHIPGLTVVTPSTPYDVKGLMNTAIQGDNPVIFVEHKKLYITKGDVPEGHYTIPFGQADVKRSGKEGQKIYGTIEKIPAGNDGLWMVNGKEVLVTRDTVIREKHGKAVVGAYVEVEGIYSDNALSASKIEVKRPER